MLKFVSLLLIIETALATPSFQITPNEIFAYQDSRISFTFENLDPKETYFLYFLSSEDKILKKITSQSININSSKVFVSLQIKKEGLTQIALVDTNRKIIVKSNLTVQKSLNFITTLKLIAQKLFK